MNPTNQPVNPLQGGQPDPQSYAVTLQPPQQTSALPAVSLLPGQSSAENSGMPQAQPGSAAQTEGALLEQTVLQARQAIEQTKTDPYQQVKAIQSLKAMYIQKRFNKTIKVSEN